MDFKFVKKGIVIATLIGAVLIPVEQIAAAEGTNLFELAKEEKASQIDQNCLMNAVAEIQKQENTDKTIKIDTIEEIQFRDKLNGKVFVNISNSYALVYGAPDENSEWIGKVYSSSVVKVTERGELWSKVESGAVVGYVKTENLLIGKDAITKATELLKAVYIDRDVTTLSIEEIDAAFTVGETKADEAARLAAEEAARIAAEKAQKDAAEAARRQRVLI